MAILATWPTPKKGSQCKMTLFWSRDFASYKCTSLPRTGKGRRKTGDEHLNKFYRWLPFLPTKKAPKPWGMEVEEGERRFSPWEDGVTPSQLWKMNHVFSIESLQIFWETCHWGYSRDDCPFWRLSIFWREQCTSSGGSNGKLKWKLKVCSMAFVGCVHLFRRSARPA